MHGFDFQEILDPLVRVSQKLQRPELNVGMTVEWVEAAVDLLESYKSRCVYCKINHKRKKYINT